MMTFKKLAFTILTICLVLASGCTAIRLARVEDQVDREVEELLADHPRGMGFCHVFWSTKKKLLKDKYGIDWKTPPERNPGVFYD